MLLLPTDPYSVRDTSIGGKYQDGVTEALYEDVLMNGGSTDFVGDSDSGEGAELLSIPEDWGIEDTWAIVSWDSMGFVYSTTYRSREFAMPVWEQVQAAYEGEESE